MSLILATNRYAAITRGRIRRIIVAGPGCVHDFFKRQFYCNSSSGSSSAMASTTVKSIRNAYDKSYSSMYSHIIAAPARSSLSSRSQQMICYSSPAIAACSHTFVQDSRYYRVDLTSSRLFSSASSMHPAKRGEPISKHYDELVDAGM
jgi:hypothetical protein